MTPLVVAKKGSKILNFYYQEDFDKWMTSGSKSSWNIEYKKGLASLEDDEYSEIIKNPLAIKIKLDRESKDTLEDWFGKDAEPRKKKLLNK